jgi:ADP-ribose pyrophosphatase
MDLATPPPEIDLVSKRTAFQGYFRIDAYTFRHRRFDGGWTEAMDREVFERGHAAAVLPYDPARNAFVLCQQFRIGAYAADFPPWQLELVAGVIEPGETPEAVARREAMEEAGCTLLDLWPVQHYLVSPGGTSESTHLYLGRVSADGAGGIFGVDAEHEHIRAVVLREDALLSMLDSGAIDNAPLLIAALWFARNRARIRERWKGGPS